MNNMSTDDLLHRMPVLVGDYGASRIGVPGLAAAPPRKFLLRALWHQANVAGQDDALVRQDRDHPAAHRHTGSDSTVYSARVLAL